MKILLVFIDIYCTLDEIARATGMELKIMKAAQAAGTDWHGRWRERQLRCRLPPPPTLRKDGPPALLAARLAQSGPRL